MKMKRIVGARGAVPVAIAAMLAAGLFGSVSGAQQVAVSTAADPEVSVNIRNERRPADRVIDFTATPGSYVTMIRVDPLGRVAVLYPATPVVDRAMIPSTKRVPVPRIPTASNPAYVGSIFAFVSQTPYVFSKVADKNGWNSLHLANYVAGTDAAIAESFGNEIAAPNSRVIMSKATTAPTMIVARDHQPTMASLADFRNKPCPTLTIPVNKGGGTIACLTQSIVLPSMGSPVPMQAQKPPTTSR